MSVGAKPAGLPAASVTTVAVLRRRLDRRPGRRAGWTGGPLDTGGPAERLGADWPHQPGPAVTVLPGRELNQFVLNQDLNQFAGYQTGS